MPRQLSFLAVVAATLGLAAPAHAWRVDESTTVNCRTGKVVSPVTEATGRAPFDHAASEERAQILVDSLEVVSGVTLSIVSEGVDGDSTAALPCEVLVDGAATISGAVRYDQGDGVTVKNVAGRLTVWSGRRQNAASGALTVGSGAAVSANGIAGGASSKHGGDGGEILLRGPEVSVKGSVQARGGAGRDGAVNVAGTVAEDGGNGGQGGKITVIADGAADMSGGTLTAEGGAGGSGGKVGQLLQEISGKAGAKGADGTVRRNILQGAATGTVVAASSPVNLSPTGLKVAGAPGGIKVTWSDKSEEETGFWVLRRANGGKWERIAVVGADATSHSDTGPFDYETTYEYQALATFAEEIWPLAWTFSNVESIRTADRPARAGGGRGTDPAKKGSDRPAGTRSDRFAISRKFRSHYRLRRGSRTISLRIRSYGDGKLMVKLPVRANRSKRARRAAARRCRGSRNRRRCLLARGTAKRTSRRTVDVEPGWNTFRFTLPRGTRAGRYTMTLTTISESGVRKTVRKRIRISYRKPKRSRRSR